MANKIDLTKTEAAQLANADLDYLKANGARALPNSPSASGWSAEAIKKQLYKQPEILFAWLKRLAESQLDLGGKINDYLDDIGSGGEFPLVFDTLANAQAAVSAGEVKAGSIVFVSNGSDIKAYYCGDGGLVSLGGDLVHKSGAETITGKKTFSGGASFTAGNVNFGSSGSDNGKTLDVYYTINLRGPVTSNTIIPGNTFALGSAEHYWGSAYIDDLFLYGAISNGTYNWAFPSKNGTIVLDSDITKSALETILGAASSSSNGYMSSSDKSHLDALYALLGSESDADSVVDTINEVLSVFNQYPEGVTIANALASKLDAADVVDNLTTNDGSKALSAKQGKALKDALDAVADDLDTAEGNIADIQTELSEKANKDSYYGTLGAGYADVAKELETKLGITQKTPISFNTVGGDSNVNTGEHRLDALTGVSVVDVQIAYISVGTTAQETNGITYERVGVNTLRISGTASAACYITLTYDSSKFPDIIAGHKYLFYVVKNGTIPAGSFLFYNVGDGGSVAVQSTEIKTYSSSYSQKQFALYIANGAVVDGTIGLFVYDLTQRYGNNTVVNAIIGNDSSTQVANLLRFDPNILKLTSYEPGSLVSSKTKELLSVWYNQWDEEWENGHIDAITGNPIAYAGKIRSKNFIKVIGGEKYGFIVGSSGGMNVYCYDINKNFIRIGTGVVEIYGNGTYTFPANVAYIRISTFGTGTTTYNHDICVFIYRDGSRIGYEPHESHPYQLPNLVQRGILKVDSDGNVYADGDVAYPNGTGETRWGSYTFTGNETWTMRGSDSAGLRSFSFSLTGKATNTVNILCTKYISSKVQGVNTLFSNYDYATNAGITKAIGSYANNGNQVLVYDTSIETAAQMASAMAGQTVIFELATPTPITFDPFTPNIFGDDFGTFQSLDENGNEANLQGFNIFYRANIGGHAESIYARTNGDPDKIAYKDEVYTKAQADARLALKEALGGTLRQVLAMKATLDFDNTNYIDMGDYEWAMFTTGGGYSYFRTVVSDLKTEADDTKMRNMLSTKYAASSWYDVYQNGKDKVVSTIGTYIVVRDTSYPDADSFNAAMKGQLISYEKAS